MSVEMEMFENLKKYVMWCKIKNTPHYFYTIYCIKYKIKYIIYL